MIRWQLLAITPRSHVAYPSELTLRLLRLALAIFLFHALWTAVEPGAAPELLAYSAFGVALQFLAPPMRDRFGERVRDGSAAYVFARPVPPQRVQLWADTGTVALGSTCVVFVMAVGTAVHLLPTRPLSHLLLLLAFAVPSAATAALIVQLVEVSTVWLRDNQGLRLLVPFVSTLLSGTLVPLDICPGWFRTTADFLPFRSMVDVPVRVYLHGLSGPGPIVTSLGWLAVLALVTRSAWKAAGRRMEVQGG
ncbi:ABC-2 family transporter protein [Streptomyces sp. RB110-1]|uniref:ABC-2 family transporter protein n=1 Tax=unclassified Streptomyces TaxID=2593676 RepID=UPI0019022E2C|nr:MULTISPECIES: ABC-2 family transporter protein [unclassified Streptomyces]MBK0377237.1 ABC-2 family transporter protein [Streptomyces sp. RB110-1]MBK0386391.1 ABC-2 family transporter protein [Streptomyces sp. RB110-2]